MLNSSIWPIDRFLSDATTPDQSRPGSKGNDGIICISQSSRITGASPSDYSESYPRNCGWEAYLYAEMQSVYSKPQSIGLIHSRAGSNSNEEVF